MSMTDPIADMLTRIRNGIRARRARVEMPSSKIKLRIAEILKEEGFIADCREVKTQGAPALEIELKWKNQDSAIIGIRRVSKPGRRHYVGKDRIPTIREGQGIAILSTSHGVLSDVKARTEAVGGEVICEVW
jgi:small subunit ribosomal protein S8